VSLGDKLQALVCIVLVVLVVAICIGSHRDGGRWR
jgi:hypothetical protein